LFGLHFIRTGVISKDAGKLYSKLFELRQTGDYDDLFNLTEEDVAPMITLVHQFLDELNGKITNYPANIVLKPDNI
jgi:uncharacterized protein (UPF0332 family)